MTASTDEEDDGSVAGKECVCSICLVEFGTIANVYACLYRMPAYCAILIALEEQTKKLTMH